VVFKFFSICTRLSARALMSLMLVAAVEVDCAGPTWPALYQSYVRAFLDNQIRVIDRDTGDRTTSEAQAYAMFFALVANDRSRFDGLLRWTELNLAAGDLTAQLPAWLWGRDSSDRWGVLDTNAAADADVWMAYVLLEAGRAWNDQRYTAIGRSLAKRIAAEEVADIGGIGPVLMPAPKGFRQDDAIRLNASYLPLQVFVGLGHLLPDGPWERIAQRISILVSASAPHGFATDWVDFASGRSFSASDAGSYDAIRVYLWAGMLDPAAPGRDAILRSLSGMADWLRKNAAPPEKVRRDGSVEVPNGPVGFSAALLPYLSAIGEKKLADAQSGRLRSALDSRTGLYGRPSKYYDQNLALFALGWTERRFWFDSSGTLRTWWKN
jgi:endo-1,4-beta-D-glucanase Y